MNVHEMIEKFCVPFDDSYLYTTGMLWIFRHPVCKKQSTIIGREFSRSYNTSNLHFHLYGNCKITLLSDQLATDYWRHVKSRISLIRPRTTSMRQPAQSIIAKDYSAERARMYKTINIAGMIYRFDVKRDPRNANEHAILRGLLSIHY